MKSIIEEASSIAKAIDQAWQRAGKPQGFTIKVFEEPVRNMFGLTVRSAKIALFFDEKSILAQVEGKKTQPEPKQRPVQQEKRDNRQPAPRATVPKPTPQEKQPHNQPPIKAQEKSQQPKQTRKQRPSWSPELIDAARKWIDNSLSIMELSNISYETSVIGNNLNIQFKNKLLATDQDERWLFSSFAHLIMLGLGQTFKKRFPNLKIILKSSN